MNTITVSSFITSIQFYKHRFVCDTIHLQLLTAPLYSEACIYLPHLLNYSPARLPPVPCYDGLCRPSSVSTHEPVKEFL